MIRGSSLTAGGSRVHREIRRAPSNEPDDAGRARQSDADKYEAFTMLAKMLHRTTLVPIGPRWLWGCSCGEHGLTQMGSAAKAAILTQQHVLAKADELMEELQPTEPSEE